MIRELIAGTFDVDSGAAFWAAVDKYRDAGFVVGWAVWMARRHGDPTSRRRVFLVTVRSDCTVEGMSAADLFAAEGASLGSVAVAVESCVDDEPENRVWSTTTTSCGCRRAIRPTMTGLVSSAAPLTRLS